ncbi:UV radiation resistance-associated gene protein isoform X2 [Eurosta solidaginis]|uniref:UV radiation resistance-associated gene protein isoform X2 n=1 Tax=Eurosta solidaginis TaxID=178769 RepID=UPI0035315862
MRQRSRWRSWLPLSTQQLRLRNLVKIEGVNVKCDNAGAVIYYTLHQSSDEDAFYLSELLTLRQELKWTEIICPRLFKANSQSVVVKVWVRFTANRSTQDQAKTSSMDSESKHLSVFKNELPSKDNFKQMSDKMLFTWGVYFSGLIQLSRHGDIKFKENSLLFHINGDCFTSANHVFWHFSDTKNTNIRRNLIETRYIQLCFKCFDIRKSYNLEQLLKLQEIQRRQLQKAKKSERIMMEIQKQSMYCINTDQFNSPHSILISNTFSSHEQKLTMGRALSELFFEQQQISPHLLLYARELKKKMEILQLKRRLFKSEYNAYSSRIEQLRAWLISLTEIRRQSQSRLESRQRHLQIEKILLSNQFQEQSLLIQKKQKIIWDMERRMSSLCLGLRKIYPIERNCNGLTTINKVPFPGINVFSDVKLSSDRNNSDNILPLTLSVSLGYIAHLVQMIALIINRPLRNGIIHQGSRSRILDIVREMPYSCSEFPLYSRSILPSKSVKHAIFLLNQNVAQLCYDIIGIRCDMLLTLDNIHYIFIYLADVQNVNVKRHMISDISQNKRFALNYCINKNVGYGCGSIENNLLSKSQSSVDIDQMQVPMTLTIPENALIQLPSTTPLSIEGACITKQRFCMNTSIRIADAGLPIPRRKIVAGRL